MKEISYKELKFNPFEMISNSWMLLTSGNIDSFNTMTVSWGQFGAIWGHSSGRPIATVYVRPQRYTKEFMDKNEYFTLSIFDENYKKDLAYLGSHSGRDEDKLSKTRISPLSISENVAFNEAKLIFICKKIYLSKIEPSGFLDPSIDEEQYPRKDYHTVYYGEIVKVFINE